MAVESGPNTITSGLQLLFDAGNTRSYPGPPTTNLVSSATAMSSWTQYYRTTSTSTFTTEFGTTGYRFVNQPSWNGIYRNFNLGSAGTYTFSAWFRFWGGSASNNGATVYVSNYGGGDTVVGLDKSKMGEWQRVSHTVSVTSPSNVYFYIISYGGTDNGTGNPDWSSWDVTMPQIQAGSTLTSFVDGTRAGNLFGLNSTVTGSLVNGPTYTSGYGGGLAFDGNDDRITIGASTYTPYCLDFWLYNNSTVPNNDGSIGGPSQYQTLWAPGSGPGISLGGWTGAATGEALHIWSTSGGAKLTYTRDSSIPSGIYNWVFNWNGSHYDIWVNGVKQNVYASSGGHAILQTYTSTAMYLATDNATYEFWGNIYVFKMYTSQLSDAQVLQNFNALRRRFGV